MTKLFINGEDVNDLLPEGSFAVNSIKGRGPLDRTASSIEVPIMHGAHFRRVKTNTRTIEVEFTIKGSNTAKKRNSVDILNGFLNTEEPVELTFSDEIEMTYYGIFVGNNDLEEIRNFGQGTLQFYCPDPFKYGKDRAYGLGDATTVFQNEGTAEVYPRFEVDVLQDITHVDYVHNNGNYMRIGVPATASQTTYELETLILHDTCSSLTGWTTADSVDHGYVAGSIISEGGRFKADTVGVAQQPYEWQGPSIKKSLSEPLSNYKMDCEFELLNVGNGTGMIEVYLKDANNNVVAKVGVEDIWRTEDITQAKFQLGNVGPDRFEKYMRAKYDYGWNNFKGIMRIWSHNNTENGERRIRPYFALIEPDGTHNWVSSKYVYVDANNDYGQDITQVQIAMRTWAPTNQMAEMYVDDIKVFRINSPADNKVQYIAKAGDTLVIDHNTEEILRNGESIKVAKEYGASFFPLVPGENPIRQYPKGALDTTVKYQERFR